MAVEIFEPKEVYVGRDFGGYEFDITDDVVQNYIAGTGDDNPWYRGHRRLAVPSRRR